MKSTAFPRTFLLALATALVAAGCGNDDDSSTGETTELTAVVGTNIDFISLVSIAAWEILEEEEGITVDQRYVEDGPTAIQAMSQGEAVIGVNIGVNVGVPAVQNGADIVDVVATQRPTWALAVAPDVDSFADLEGEPLAVHGEASFTRAVSRYFAQQNDFEYEELIIPGSDVRAEALARGQITASVIDLPDVVQLSKTFPGSFKVLATIGEEFPDLIEQDLWLSREWAEENEELATKVVGAVVSAMRKLTEDTDYALELATENLPEMDEDVLADLVAEYSERGLWPADGLLTADRALTTLQFFADSGEIEMDDVSEDVLAEYFDFSYLENALAELDG